MTSLASALSFGLAPADHSVGIIGLPAKRSAKRALPGSAGSVLKEINAILEGHLDYVIQQRTAEDFERVASETFPKYCALVMAFSGIASTLVPRDAMARLSADSFSEIEADIRANGDAALGESIRERAVFTVWTLRKIGSLLDAIDSAPALDRTLREKDNDLYKEFLIHALWARFYVDCITASMRTGHALYPAVMPVVDNGLRSIVNAYAWAKQAVDLRLGSDDDEAPFEDAWSDDAEALTRASMNDLRADAAE